MRISDWSSDVCSSDLPAMPRQAAEVAVREIPAPLSTVELPAVPARPVTAPDLRAEQAPSVAVRDIPAPTAAPTPEAAGSTASSQAAAQERSEAHTSELQSLMRTSYAVSCWTQKKTT